MKSLLALFLSLTAIVFITGCASSVENTTHTFNTVVIDPGHGGRDSGTHSRWHRGILEKNLTIKVAKLLNEKLTTAGFRTVMTRKGDYYVSLDKRCAISNRQRNAIYISIHFNDAPRRAAHGILTFYRSSGSVELAKCVERHLGQTLHNADGIRYANYHVLRDNRFPAILIECGFLSNRRESVTCCSAYYQNGIADAITDALLELRKR